MKSNVCSELKKVSFKDLIAALCMFMTKRIVFIYYMYEFILFSEKYSDNGSVTVHFNRQFLIQGIRRPLYLLRTELD